MRSKARITSVHAALRRQRLANARTLMGYSENGIDGPLWLNGRIIPDSEVTANDTVIRICYQAPADAQNVVRLRWGDDDNPMHDAGDA